MGLPSLLSKLPTQAQEESKQFVQLVSFGWERRSSGRYSDGSGDHSIAEHHTLPSAPGFILGMINLRGKIIPIIDLRRRLKIRGRHVGVNDRKTRILIVEILAT